MTLTPTRILDRKRPLIGGFPALWDLAERVVQGAVNEGLMPPDDRVARQEDREHIGR